MTSSSSASSAKLKEEGNKLFMKRNYKEAIDLYSKALEKDTVSIYYVNRALCYLKLQQWPKAVDDCRRAVELDPHSVKAHFFLGQALCELSSFDEGIFNLKRAHELAKDSNENYGDEITRTIRNAKRRRWSCLEDKRVKQDIELQSYLTRLIAEDKQKQIKKVLANGSGGDDPGVTAAAAADASSNGNLDAVTSASASSSSSTSAPASSPNSLKLKEKELLGDIDADFERKVDELNRLFNENDARRRKREIPDYLCGKISFELMKEPVIAPSGITYDRHDIEQHLYRVGRFDPITRQELTIDQLIPNLSMKEVIENFVNENEWVDGAL